MNLPNGLALNVFVMGWCAGLIFAQTVPGHASIWLLAGILAVNAAWITFVVMWKKRQIQ